MTGKPQKLSALAQNVILGTITGVMVGYNLRILFVRLGTTDLIWILFFVLGPLLGYLSGKERMRMEKLKAEKNKLEENLDKIQSALKKSAKKYKLLVEHANDAIFLTSSNGKFLLFNDATCLYSGYKREELKRMNISQLQQAGSDKAQDGKSWLDNGVYRYEENWRSKNGSVVTLDINSRWIQLGGHRLILSIGRDILRQKEADREEKALDIKQIQENKLVEMASVHRALYRQVLGPLNNTIKLLEEFARKYPAETPKIKEVMSSWQQTKSVLQGLPSKNARDIASSPSRWNINDIITQELHYLETLHDAISSIAHTTFASGLPPVFGFGRDFSLAFGTIFKAAYESVKTSRNKEFSISTQAMDDIILVELKLKENTDFGESLCNVIDPFYENNGIHEKKKGEIGLLVSQLFFETLGGKLDIASRKGQGTVIRIRIPTVFEKGKDKENKIKLVGDEDSIII